MWKWLLILILVLPSLCFAESNVSLFSVSPTDKSMEYLGIALGNVPGSPISCEGNPLIGSLFYVFNHIIFVLGIIIISYTTIVGTLTTAQEGEFFGKQKWHPILVPFRSAIGIYLLIPKASGFNLIQMTVIWFIVQGVGAANALWKQVIQYNQAQHAQYVDHKEVQLSQIGKTVNAIFNANVCMHAFNADSEASRILGEKITVYRWNNKIEWGRSGHAGQEHPLCGSIELPSQSWFNKSNDLHDQNQTFAHAIIEAQKVLDLPAQDALEFSQESSANSFVLAANLLNHAAQTLNKTHYENTKIYEKAVEDGWIHAGNYYFKIVQSEVKPSIHFSHHQPNTQSLENILGKSLSLKILNTSEHASSEYTKSSADNIMSPSKNKLNLSNNQDIQFTGFFSYLFGDLMQKSVKYFSHEITSGSPTQDPIVSMASFGSMLTSATELIFWGVFGSSLVSWLASTFFGGFTKLDTALSFVIPVTMLMISVVYTAGCVLAVYIPLIPYFVFTFTGFGWLILVIEALLGSSLIALSFIVPSEDEIGKAGHAIVILLGLFLRPALMIIGFIFAIQLLYVATKMLDFGFWEVILSTTGANSNISVFSMLVIVILYVGIVTTFTHEAFSLIYVLPNKVLRWIAGTGEEDSATQKAKELKGHIQKGGGYVKGTMSGAITQVNSRIGRRA